MAKIKWQDLEKLAWHSESVDKFLQIFQSFCMDILKIFMHFCGEIYDLLKIKGWGRALVQQNCYSFVTEGQSKGKVAYNRGLPLPNPTLANEDLVGLRSPFIED